LSEDVLSHVARFISACDLPGGRIDVVWHAGEPLIAGQDFYNTAFRILAEGTPPNVSFRHIIQTNGTLITEGWCDFFKRHDVSIGLSVDGPAEIHDRYRRTWSGRASHAMTMRGLRLLREAGFHPTALCVLTDCALRNPDEIYDFLVEAEFDNVGFNVEAAEGVNRRTSLDHMSGEQLGSLYRSFMRRIWSRWRADGSRMLIREFDQMVRAILQVRNDSSFVIESDEVVPFRIMTIDQTGSISTFSPELAATKSEVYNDFVIGNVITDEPLAIARGLPFQRLRQDLAVGQHLCESQCQYFKLCGGGFFANRFIERGSFAAKETLPCRLQRQALADLLIGELVVESRSHDSGSEPRSYTLSQ
jgi:uncharacterized protein